MSTDADAFFFKHLHTYGTCEAEGGSKSAAEVAAASDIVEAAVPEHCGKIAVGGSGQSAQL